MTPGSAAYRRVEIETASPAKLVVMLYNGAIRNAEDAREAIGSKDTAAAHRHLLRAQDIVTELRSALNLGVGEVAENLDRVYDYLYRLLVRANVEKAVAPIDECVGHLRSLRDAWEEVFQRAAREGDDESHRMNPHGHSILNFEG